MCSRKVFGEHGEFLGRADSLCFTHVRAVHPDADEAPDPLDEDVTLLVEGVSDDPMPGIEPVGEDEVFDPECDCVVGECARVLDFSRFAPEPDYPLAPPDYASLVVPPQPDDEVLRVGGGSNTHRGVKCRRK